MNRNPRFWYSLLVFQFLFGLAVFALTREYYAPDTPVIKPQATTAGRRAPEWSASIVAADVARLGAQAPVSLPTDDPVEISRQAEQYFAARQFDKAAAMYERLLEFGPKNGEIHNNLGLTLHYMGKSDEALRRLNEGIAVDPENQRIWLTLGYVNSEVGNTAQAREALTKATQLGADESIRQSAMTMLEALP
ncbi:MAG: tetratricopeptide repeat protein [Pseudomonadales bacterium]|nr:tetratricopeptide repeat protein [Halioglobus sp.]MCP5121151.1 tetratricopeptide repeat protein [Pseudomonadales bacterium]MCP5193509.1 tetratricopeptide repeat protein [Pseudomonadales bacterium]